jgi:hypothetical protein
VIIERLVHAPARLAAVGVWLASARLWRGGGRSQGHALYVSLRRRAAAGMDEREGECGCAQAPAASNSVLFLPRSDTFLLSRYLVLPSLVSSPLATT